MKKYQSHDKINNDILFAITNINDKSYIQNIINHIPLEYNVHVIGYFTEDTLTRCEGTIVFHGFVDIKNIFKKYNFCMAFTRGGFATIDIVKRNIPCFCISSNSQGLYLELLSKENFLALSNCNFVTRKQYDAINISNGIDLIERCCKKYQCYDLLKKHNNIKSMLDIYQIYHVSIFSYYRYKLLSKITFGKMRKHYKKKRKEMKAKLKEERRFWSGNK